MDYLKIAQQHIAEEYPQIVYGKPQISELPPGAILGTWAYSVPGKVRFMIDAQRELATGVLPADVTRAWIRDEYKLPLRRRKSQFNTHFTLPLHARKGEWGNCVYVDLEKAYLNVLKFGYDVEFVRGKYLAVDPRPVPEIIQKHKFCYSIAVAMSNSRMSNISIVGKEGVFTQEKFNTFSNPCLYAFACELLSSVASEVMRVMGQHVRYINTDGIIVPEDYHEPLINIIQSWGLNAGIKHEGQTRIWGVGSFRCGDFQTRRVNLNAQDFTSNMPSKDESLWLKQIFTKLQQNYGTMLTS